MEVACTHADSAKEGVFSGMSDTGGGSVADHDGLKMNPYLLRNHLTVEPVCDAAEAAGDTRLKHGAFYFMSAMELGWVAAVHHLASAPNASDAMSVLGEEFLFESLDDVLESPKVPVDMDWMSVRKNT